MQNKIIYIPNISCIHCVHTIKSELAALEGVISVDVDMESKEVKIAWKEELLDWDSIKNVLVEINYPAAE